VADLQSIIKIIFSGDDQLSGTVRGASQSIADFSGSVTALASPFADIANKILLLDTAITAVAAVIAGKAIQASNDFGASINVLTRFMDESDGSVASYQAQFESLAVTYGAKVTDIVASTADWKAANYDIKTSLELTKVAMDFSIAGQTSAAQATTELKSILAGMAVTQDVATASATRMGDVIAYIGAQSSVGFKEVAEGMAIIAPAVNTSGASFEHMSALMSVLADSLQSGTMAGDAFKTMMSQLAQPSKIAREGLEQFGVTFDKFGITQQSFSGVLDLIAAKWDGLTSSQKNNTAQMIFSGAEAPRFMALMDNWGNVTQRTADAVVKANDYMAKNVAKSLEDTSAAFKSFSSALNILFIDLGQSIDPGVAAVVRSMTGIETAINSVFKQQNSPFAPFVAAANDALKGLSSVFDSIAGNLDSALELVDFSGLLGSLKSLFGELGTLFGSFFGEIDLTTIDGLAVALQKLTDAGTFLVRSTEGIAKAFEPFFAAAGRAVENFTQLDKASQLDFGEFIGSAKALVDAGVGVGLALIAIGKAGVDMGSALDAVFGGVKVAVNTLQVGFDAAVLGFLKIKEAALQAGIFINEFANFGETPQSKEWRASLADLKTVIGAVNENLQKNKSELEGGYNQAVGNADAKTAALNARLADSEAALRKVGDSGKEGAAGVNETVASLQKLIDIKLPKIEIAPSLPSADIAEAAGQLTRVGEAAQTLVPRLVTVRDENGKVINSYTEMTNVIPGVTGTLSVLGSGIDKTAQKTDEATKKSETYQLKLLEISSNERIKNIESFVKLNIADLEANAKIVEATFKSIDTTINSTGTLLGSLFGDLTGADFHARATIERQIDLENQRRQEALDIQKNLAEAEIQRINAQTDALNRGDALIRIDGTGLKPELEAFMWKILEAIQVRANAKFQDYLLGLAPA
jgi:TP901 family phage tail tape measure protein